MTKDRPCPTCGETRCTEFWKDKTRREKLQVQCKTCLRNSQAAYRRRMRQSPAWIAKRREDYRNWYHRQKTQPTL